jgi:hypothetical protein
MNILRVIAILVGLVSVANAQTGTPTKQSGSVTPLHVTCWTTNGIIQDCGTAAAGLLSSLGVTASGSGICQNSASTSGAYNQLCFNTTTSGGGGFSLNNVGGATGGFTLTINGVTQQFITAPVALTVGQTVCAATAGTLTSNCPTLTITAPSGLTSLTSPAINTLQLGAADANPAVAQTLQVQNGEGTNIAGQNFTIIGSLSTGTANSGDIIFQTGVKNGSSGAGDATPTTALTLKGETQTAIFAGLIQGPNGFSVSNQNGNLQTSGNGAFNNSTAIPAGGLSSVGIFATSSSTNFGVFFGSGAPTLSAAQGSIYLRSDGTTTNNRAYINSSSGSGTTWTALITAG